MLNKKEPECCDLNIIVSNFYHQLKKYIVSKIGDIHLAEDIVQDVMLKVVSSHKKNIQVKNVKAWMYQITRNTLIDYSRKNKNKIENCNEYIDEILFTIKEDSFNPKEYLIPMIKLLPDKYGIPLLLGDIENKPQAEIAKIIGISFSATKMRIQRARKMLYNLFVECCDIQYSQNGAFLHCTVKENCIPLRNLKNNL